MDVTDSTTDTDQESSVKTSQTSRILGPDYLKIGNQFYSYHQKVAR